VLFNFAISKARTRISSIEYQGKIITNYEQLTICKAVAYFKA